MEEKINILYNIINRLKLTTNTKKKDIEALENIADILLLTELKK
jgi:hypothetical protein|tara:strand:+ start:980 stop:1111 length:132 start_codon:yes stop_codon:yes gene_type:complete